MWGFADRSAGRLWRMPTKPADWRIYAEFAHRLIAQARRLYFRRESVGRFEGHRLCVGSQRPSDLCLSLFPWAHFRSAKAAVKMHTLLDLRGDIPSFIHISDGKLHDVHALDMPNSARSRCDLCHAGPWVCRLRPALATRAASSRRLLRDPCQVQSQCSIGCIRPPLDRTTGVIADQDNHARRALHEQRLSDASPEVLRFRDPKTGKTRWHVSYQPNSLTGIDDLRLIQKAAGRLSCSFKWIKQHLRIKQFYGTSKNAVKTHRFGSLCQFTCWPPSSASA